MRKKRFLWLLPYYPYPPITGGNVRIYNLIKRLSQYYDIHVLSYCDNKIENNHIKAIEKYCKLSIVQRKQIEGDLPLIFQYYTTQEMKDELKLCLKARYDFIQIDFLTMAYYIHLIKDFSDIPVFFTEHDMSSFYFEKCFHNRHLPEKQRYIEWLKMRKTMDEIYPKFNAVFTVSHSDALILKRIKPDLRVYAAPTGTDCGFYTYKHKRDTNDLIFVGHFLHYPNVDAVNYFVTEVFPLIRKKWDIKFNIVGSSGYEAFGNIKEKNINVTGTVSDIRDYLYGSGIFVAPLRLGIGIRGKILEAMAAGLPVVSTSLGAKGINAKAGEHLLIADKPAAFASQIERLIENVDLKELLVKNSREFVEKKFDWLPIVADLIKIYKNLLKQFA
jgi:glycosyltransferase involved in cell wall biosynthesis